MKRAKVTKVFAIFLVIAFYFIPALPVSAEEPPLENRKAVLDEIKAEMGIGYGDGKNLAEVLGELGFSLVKQSPVYVNATQGEKDAAEETFGEMIITILTERGNTAGEILKGFLKGDSLSAQWPDIVDFLIPTFDKDGRPYEIDVTVSDPLKSAIAEAIPRVVKERDLIVVPSGYQHIGDFVSDDWYAGYYLPLNIVADEGLEEISVKIYTDYPLGNVRIDRTIKQPSGNVYSGSGYGDGKNYLTRPNEYTFNFPVDMGYSGTLVKLDGLILWASGTVPGDLPKYNVYTLMVYGEEKETTFSSMLDDDVLKNTPQQTYDELKRSTGKDVVIEKVIRDDYPKFEDYEPPPYQNDPGTENGIWNSLLELLSGLMDFIASIPDFIASLLDGLLGVLETVVHWFIPTSEQIDDLGQRIQKIADDFTGKFTPITDFAGAVTAVFSKPKDFFDIEITMFGHTSPIVPEFLRGQLDRSRTLMSGVVVLFTAVNIYKRFTGSGDVIKS